MLLKGTGVTQTDLIQSTVAEGLAATTAGH